MKYFLLSQNLEANEGYISWSERPCEREPSPQNEYWPNINTDRTETGRLEIEFKKKISDLWLLTKHRASNTPDLLGSFSEGRFSGNPIVSYKLKEGIEKNNIIGDFEFIEIENFWSIPDNIKIDNKYYYMNIFGQRSFFDVKASKSKKIPEFGQSATHRISDVLMSNFKLKAGVFPREDIFRDKATNIPICSLKFLGVIQSFKAKSVEARSFQE